MTEISKMTILRKLVWLKKTASQLPFVFGLIYGVFQYEVSKLDGQVKQTLSFYDKFNSSPFVGYRENLSDVMSEIKASPKSDESYESFASEILKRVKEKDKKRALNMMLDFFDGLTACMKDGICDRGTAKQLFQARADETYTNFFPYICWVRETNKSGEYAKSLFYIASQIEDSGFFAKWYRKVNSY